MKNIQNLGFFFTHPLICYMGLENMTQQLIKVIIKEDLLPYLFLSNTILGKSLTLNTKKIGQMYNCKQYKPEGQPAAVKMCKVAHSEQEVVQRQDLHLVEHFEAALRHVLHHEDPLLRSP